MSPHERKKKLDVIYHSFKKKVDDNLKLKIFIILFPFLLVTLSLVYILKDIPNPSRLTKYPAPVSTKILDRNGELLYDVYSDQNRTPIKIQEAPKYLIQATVAIEDKNFYNHHGLDFMGILRAGFNTLSGKRLEGGSTITQQLVKNALLADRSRNLQRKIREAILALGTEFVYSKDQILELYLNHAPYGGTAYGIESAAQIFFNKKTSELNLAEASLLAGLPQSPTKYSPFGANPDLAISRQAQVLRRMVEDGYITNDQAEEAKNTKLIFASRKTQLKAPHFSLMVRDSLVEKYGEDKVNLGGLRVTTTLDLSLQEYAEASLSAEIKKLKNMKIGNGASLVTKPITGEILVMVGSKDYFNTADDGNVNLTQRLRQPGSSIKPLNYAAGLLAGWTASTSFLDLPTCFNVTGQKQYCPKNYDNSFHGPVQMRFALGNSYNIPAVKMLALNGLNEFIATASAMGITTWTDPSQYGLSLTLGGGEIYMTDLATAYGTLANSGVTVPLNPIIKVETYTGEILYDRNLEEEKKTNEGLKQNWETFWKSQADLENRKIRVSLPEEVAYIISHILLDNNARVGAFGPSSQLVIPGKTVSVKTGTTNDLRDNWTFGYTQDYLVASWVGNNDNTPMSYVTSGVTGASSIWNTLMKKVLKDQKDVFPAKPEGVESKDVCNNTGLLPTAENFCETRSELFVKGVNPSPNIPTKKQVWVRRSDKFPYLSGDTAIDLDLEEHLVASDPFVIDFCLDCNYPKDEKGQTIYPITNVNFNQKWVRK